MSKRNQSAAPLACETPARSSGTYVLLLELFDRRTVQVGKLGAFHFNPGWYLYVGSAFGPGGVVARLRHHLRASARPHWHIDYLRFHAGVPEVWYELSAERREHLWAGAIAKIRDNIQPVPRFGASDCSCTAHLFYLHRRPSLTTFRRALRAARVPDDGIAIAVPGRPGSLSARRTCFGLE